MQTGCLLLAGSCPRPSPAVWQPATRSTDARMTGLMRLNDWNTGRNVYGQRPPHRRAGKGIKQSRPRSAPGPVGARPGHESPLLAAGPGRAVDPGDEVTPVPSAAGAAGTLPVSPGEQGSELAARPSAGTAPAKRRPMDRRPPQARADESSYNRGENGELGDADAQNEHHEQKQS